MKLSARTTGAVAVMALAAACGTAVDRAPMTDHNRPHAALDQPAPRTELKTATFALG